MTANTAYTARAFSTNEIGTGYSGTTTYTTLRNPGIFYMRADVALTGGSLVDATGHPEYELDVSKCIGRQNTGPFVGDDLIYVSDKGGAYKPPAGTYDTNAYGIIAPSDGFSGHPVVYKNVPGETPTFDLSLIDNGTDWSAIDLGGGGGTVYQKTFVNADWIRVIWEDGAALHRVSDVSGDAPGVGTNDANGILQEWSYSGHVVTYKPRSGTPGSHTLRLMWPQDQIGDLMELIYKIVVILMCTA